MDTMKIDWETFAARVPAGTRIYVNEFRIQGILMENKPYHMLDTNSDMRAQSDYRDDDFDFLPPDYIDYQSLSSAPGYFGPSMGAPTEFRYFIDGRWLTFAEVMQGDISRPEG